MNQPADTKRLADVTAALASTILEIINERLRAISAAQEEKVAPATIEPVLTKRQVAELLQVSVRTVDQWMGRGYLPYYRIGRNVRFRMSEIHSYWGLHRG